MWFIDKLNIWGLVLIGLGLMLGVLICLAAVGGIALLGLYYVTYPPLFAPVVQGAEGSYLIVNKNLVELFALTVVAALPAASFGLGRLVFCWRRTRAPNVATIEVPRFGPLERREALTALVGVPVFGALMLAILKKHGWRRFEEAQLRARENPRDVFKAGATVKSSSSPA